ncbi:MAG TPA: 6,7-dimethyl-8-ribityllumazine synthase [Chitinophagaceae bacterium]|jgi:6,7-dimethyl-8-ribityllumazine synthase|nr:6,7-dimethyl-8-ribityllumazine synthase [Chitinophagaceae bacterium]
MSEHNRTLLNDSGIPDSRDAVVVLVYTEWNEAVVNELVNGCEKTLRGHGVREIVKVRVPGAVELPFACSRYFEATSDGPGRPDALIALGCVLRGGTPHFDYVCQSVTQGITHLNLQLPVPVIFGVLTVDTMEQALERIGGTHGHKGEEVAVTALKMIAFNRKIS